jgi:hypothetical protein
MGSRHATARQFALGQIAAFDVPAMAMMDKLQCDGQGGRVRNRR